MHPEILARLPRTYRALLSAVQRSGWDHTVATVGPMRVGDARREVVELAAVTRAGRRVRGWWTADAPPEHSRPRFRAAGAYAGQGRAVADVSMAGAVAYVLAHPQSG